MVLIQPSVFSGEHSRKSLVDLAVLVLQYESQVGEDSSLPLPLTCELASGCQLQSMISCSGFLEPGNYAILPLAFNHWVLNSIPKLRAEDEAIAAGSKPCWVALHSSKQVHCQNKAKTGPGFLAESIFLLESRAQTRRYVS